LADAAAAAAMMASPALVKRRRPQLWPDVPVSSLIPHASMLLQGGRKRRSEWGWALTERPAADAEDDAAASPCCPQTACCFQRILFTLHLLLAYVVHRCLQKAQHRDGWRASRSVRRERESVASLQTSGCTS